MKAKSVLSDGYKSRVDNGRGHSIVVDLPQAQGGTDEGPTALELAVMSLTSCITSIFKVIAVKRGFRFRSVTADIVATRAEGAPTITAVTGTVKVVTDEPQGEAENVLRLTLPSCPVGALFGQAGIKPKLTLTTEKPNRLATC